MRTVIKQPPLQKVIPTPISSNDVHGLDQELGNALGKAFRAHVHASAHRL